ncbi:uncharacterized protein MELLADRAFT_105645 [Melampsora larici-populina 98AG31]|uniref:Secreted protein n=1 Tax=Melampsora larici-populina (strain 98AG31 / pathotype 3-4-7) TaxID=747676 RepID=F4RIW5_MELLP|nr:uncharacterized protein MELLADRAFT_105645 [Melampsora larici-populina 98AG31]EGG07634.1 hypothetical protein MELLADRAFT_105645 [Melampsora larici-populina 98AG31]
MSPCAQNFFLCRLLFSALFFPLTSLLEIFTMPILPTSVKQQQGAHQGWLTAERMSPYSRGPPPNSRSPSVALLLRSLNNHGALQNCSDHFLTSTSMQGSPSALEVGPNNRALQSIVPGMGNTPSQSSQNNISGTPSTQGAISNLGIQPMSPDHSGNELEANHLGGEREDQALTDIARPLTASEQAFLQALSTECGLDEHHQDYVQTLAWQSNLSMRVTGLVETITGLVKTVTGLADTVQALADEIRTPGLVAARAVPAPVTGGPTPASAASSNAAAPTTPWVASSLLLDAISQLADKKVTLPLLEGYTALKAANGVTLTNSLFNIVKLELAKKPAAWKDEHLPRKVLGITDSQGVKQYYTDIKNGCKHARGKMHNSVLSGVYESKAGVILTNPVPDLPELVFIIGKGPTSIWAAVDKQLEKLLREERNRMGKDGYTSGDYTASCVSFLYHQYGLVVTYTESKNGSRFYKVVYDQDRDYFTGKTLFQDLIKLYSFELPSEDQIEAGIAPTPTQNVEQMELNEEGLMDI